ncbi:hypothetical protein CAPTEDRAFT_221133 [Capitella teleta]|uniref:Aminopeptidase n=1 Tax=Capitella teleta TaxID=283909 RepID=R7USU9_CAPTE|nr:hypothetical protein CAPTEDRAFT_221133 [Capitella teleta]|eukprot:ELU09285.1 hypothetical protein CAPTEDRAFT_221133 [Capitella teleta]
MQIPIWLCVLGSVVSGWSTGPSGELPNSLLPEEYTLLLHPNIYNPGGAPFDTSGRVNVIFLCVQDTDFIVLNSKNLQIHEVRVSDEDSGSPLEIKEVLLEPESEFLVIEVSTSLNNGTRYSAEINFTGVLNSYYEGGLVWDQYQEGNTTKFLTWSDMHPHNARTVFPCFDEPQYKAKFSVILLRKPHMTSLTNAHLLRTEEWEDDYLADYFAPTPEMSSYLLCFVICEFAHLEAYTSSGTLVRVWARPDVIEATELALSTAVSVQEWLEEYTGLPDPMQKMDHIALPSKGGGMENWGLITYAEKILLWKNDWFDSSNKQSTAVTVAHELAHMWFGNLVTLHWWNDTWLNEGFASYFESSAMDDVLKWESRQLNLERRLLKTLGFDVSNTTSPVRPEIESVWQAIEAFTGSQYSKGASILRMVQQVLTPETFQSGIQRYLENFAYSTATSDDLWESLSEQAAIDGITDTDGSPLIMKQKFDPWLDQIGYPIVHVSWDPTTTTINLTQSHFNPEAHEFPNSEYNYKWNIPITIGDRSSSAALHSVIEDESLAGDWIMINIGAHTLCRVQYDEETFEHIAEQLQTDHQIIHPESRVLFLEDSFSLAQYVHVYSIIEFRVTYSLYRYGLITFVDALKATRYMASELEGLAWMQVAQGLSYPIRVLHRYEETWQLFDQYLRELTDPVYQYVGWDSSEQEDIYFSFLRKVVLGLSCWLSNEDCLLSSNLRFQQWRIEPDSIAVDQRSVVYCYGVRQGTQSDWNLVHERYLNLTSSRWLHENEEKHRLRKALSCSSDVDILQSYLQLVLTDQVPDASSALDELAGALYGRWVVWEHLKQNWRNETAIPSRRGSLHSVVEGFVTDEDADEFAEFVLTYPPQDAIEEEILLSAEYIIEKNLDWVNTNQQPVHEWLDEILLPNDLALEL